MAIDVNKKISDLLKEDDRMLDVLLSVSPAFSKLKNPVLRKAIASRVTVRDAARIGRIPVREFLQKLKDAGYDVDFAGAETEVLVPKKCDELKHYRTVSLDVRPVLARGEDPFDLIRKRLNALAEGEALDIVLDFEPTPLIDIFSRSGFAHCTVCHDDGTVHTYFFKPVKKKGLFARLAGLFGSTGKSEEATEEIQPVETVEVEDEKRFDELMREYAGSIETTDVRGMAMPVPMMTILEKLSRLPEGKALLVEHERIPQYLLPELKKRGKHIAAKKSEDGHYRLLIY